MHHRRRSLIGGHTNFARLLLAVVLSVNCASYTAGLRPSDKPSPTRSYLYGRFYIEAKSTLLGMDDHQSIGFVIHCADRSTYTIRFSNEKRIEVIQVKPSRCALVSVVFTDADGVVRRRTRVSQGSARGQEFAGGTAYYLGDFSAKAGVESSWKFFYTEFESSWEVNGVEDNYDLTTAEMKRVFANLGALPTENRALAPRKRPSGQPPSGPQASRAPQKLAAVDADGETGRAADVMTPERVARIGPYTKPFFATLAKCEAACPGECLPFKAETGPVITCIVRCKIDKDCPAGMACNCPNSDGPDCRSIAQPPGMAGICLSVEPAGER